MSKEVGEGSVVVAELRTDLVTFHLARLHVENHLQQEQKKRGKRNHRAGGKQDNLEIRVKRGGDDPNMSGIKK